MENKDNFPMWIKLLDGTYPAASGKQQARYMQCIALAAVYEDEEPELMRAAVKGYLASEKWFPKPADLKTYVERVDWNRHLDKPVAREVLPSLPRLRSQLLTRAYSGQASAEEWQELIDLMRKQGREYMAANLERKREELMQAVAA